MQFLVLGYDGTDDGAMDRRMKARPEHLALGDQMVADGSLWYAAALTDEEGNMKGSMYMVNFPDRGALDAWLDVEPYMQQGVWERTEITPCKTRDPWQFNRPKEFFEA